MLSIVQYYHLEVSPLYVFIFLDFLVVYYMSDIQILAPILKVLFDSFLYIVLFPMCTDCFYDFLIFFVMSIVIASFMSAQASFRAMFVCCDFLFLCTP